jgi:Mor family transcriptional regulator
MSKNIEENKFYVYVYLDPRKPGKFCYGNYCFLYEPFYVGKGFGNRIYNHLYPCIINIEKTFPKTKMIVKLLSLNYDLKKFIIKLHANISEKESFSLEKNIISLIGRRDIKLGPLLNLTNGGEGSSGWKPSKKSIKKMSENAKKQKYKYLLTEEQKNKILELVGKIPRTRIFKELKLSRREVAKFLKNIPMVLSEESKEKMSKAKIGKIPKNLKQIHQNLREKNKIKKIKNKKRDIEIINLYKTEKSIKEISEKYKISDVTIYGILKSNGIDTSKRKKKINNSEFSNIINLYSNGKTQMEISKIYNVSQCTINEIINGKY